MRTWVLHYCREGRWTVEDWIYSDYDAAMYWAENYMIHDADAAVIEEITNDNTHSRTGFLTEDSRARHGWAPINPNYPWNFAQKDWLRGVKVRERHRKKHRQE